MAVSFEYHCYAISAFTMSVFFCTLSSSQVDLSKSQSTHAHKSQNSLLKAAVKIHLLALYTSQKEEGSIVRCGLSISLSNVSGGAKNLLHNWIFVFKRVSTKYCTQAISTKHSWWGYFPNTAQKSRKSFHYSLWTTS